MNVKALREEGKIRKLEFGEHVVGFRFGPYPEDQRIYRPFGSSQGSRKQISRQSTRPLLTSSGRSVKDILKLHQ